MAKLPTNETIAINLNDILASIIYARNFVSGMTLEEFLEDDKAISAVSRSLQLISRKASFISRLTRLNQDAQKVNLPYSELTSMERRLNHLYQKVPPEIIWHTIDRDLDDLEDRVRRSLGNRVSDSLPARITKYPKIQLFKQDEEYNLTSSVLYSKLNVTHSFW